MRDPITDAAQDSSCLLCLTPDRGGSWWSRLRPPMPRNFADNPMTYTDAKTALDVMDQSHDFTFEIEFKCVKTNAVYIFASDASNDFIRVFMSSGEIIVSTALMSTSPGGSTRFSAGSDSTNRHALTVKMIENTITALIDGEIVYTRENLVRNAIEISAPRSNAGYVYKISITDDTTGETVWQAAYSDLHAIYEPRNFSAAPMLWGRFETLTAGYNGDFIFRIVTNFHSISDNPNKNEFFFNSRWVPFALRMNSETRLFGWLNGSDPDAGVELSVDLPVSILGMHVLEVARTGFEFVITFDGVEIYRTSVDAVRAFPEPASGSAIRSHYHSDFDGSIMEADFSAPALSWSAPHGDLYNMLPPPPWPSPVPRDFSAEPMRFYELADIAQTVGTGDDFEVGFRLQWFTNPLGKTILPFSNQPYDFRINNNGNVYFYCSAGKTAGQTQISMRVSEFAINTVGIYEISASVVGSVATLYVAELDNSGNVIRSASSQAAIIERQAPTRTAYMVSNFSGTLLDAWVSRNGKRIWGYPSEAERVRLITKTNVRTDRGVFEAADETQPARVDTALDLRGKVSSYTVVVDFEAAEFPETTTMECHQELAGQGGALIGSSYPPICSIGYYLASSGSARLQLSQEVAGGRHVVNATLTGRLSGRHICCGVVEVDPASPLTASTLYLDGVRIGNASIYAVPTGNAAVNATCFSIAGHSFTGGWASYTGKVYSGLLFDRALSAAEIAALTPKQA